MNRRGFLSALALAPVAAVVAPTTISKPPVARAGVLYGNISKWGYLGETGPEVVNLPTPGDKHILELARQGAAEAIRTYNRRLTSYESRRA